MVIIIHGDDTVASRKKIDEYTRDFKNVSRINLVKDDFLLVSNTIESQDLFDNRKAIVIEHFAKTKNKLENIAALINRNKNLSNLNIILWEDEKADDRIIKKFEAKNVFLCDLPKFYFQFLDSIFPGNKIKCVDLFKNVSKKSSEEQLFYSIIKRIRTLMIIKSGEQSEFEETKKMSGWQLGKLLNQAKPWNEQKLMDFYKKLFEIELNMKTSNLPMSLSKHIDILLLSL